MQVFGFAGWSGSGKTTLIERLIALFVADGLRVATIKHTHHDFDLDHPGKDSWRHRKAGATEVLLTSDRRWALLHELGDAPEPDLQTLLAKLEPCDAVLIEGCKFADVPKLEVYRAALGKPGLHVGDSAIIAVVTDSVVQTNLPCLDINQPQQVYDFLKARL
jgi:molybdopterin-guanine dinucleotide biosynthesis adapter protein